MTFDTLIIGGGLTGLVSGLCLQQRGQRVAIVSFGQSLLHFSSGSLSGDAPVEHACSLLRDAGIGFTLGGYRLTPLGTLVPAALTLDGYYHAQQPAMPEESVAIVRLPGYLGLPIELMQHNLQAAGKAVRTISPDDAQHCPVDLVLVPACAAGDRLAAQCGRKVRLVAAMPPSIPGQRLHHSLQARFEALGGTYFAGDRATAAQIEGDRVVSVTTERLADDPIRAEHYILATGSFQSEGLQSNYERIYEPLFGLDTNAPADRTQWTDADFFADQPYQRYGVVCDAEGHAMREGRAIQNLYPAGHILGGLRTDTQNLNEALTICSKLV